MIHVAIAGIDGDLGQAIASMIRDTPGMSVTGCTSIAEPYSPVPRRIESVLDGADVLVDVTSPGEAMTNVPACLSIGCAIVTGCGPLDPNHIAELKEYSQRIPVFNAPDLCLETAAILSVLPALRETLPHLDVEKSGVDRYRRRRAIDDWSQLLGEPVAFMTGGGQEIVVSQKLYGQEARARGAVRAIQFLAHRERGFYTTDHLLRDTTAATGTGSSGQELSRVR